MSIVRGTVNWTALNAPSAGGRALAPVTSFPAKNKFFKNKLSRNQEATSIPEQKFLTISS